jgi:hypothetical protein
LYKDDSLYKIKNNIGDAWILESSLKKLNITAPKMFSIEDYSLAPVPVVKSFDTGGYTGEWGPEGRWAMLHQKEIVLNAKDTENLLSAVDILRDMQNNLLTSEMAKLINQFTNSISNNISNMNNQSNETKQEVYINADFSGVSSAAEIEEAFNNLINELNHM